LAKQWNLSYAKEFIEKKRGSGKGSETHLTLHQGKGGTPQNGGGLKPAIKGGNCPSKTAVPSGMKANPKRGTILLGKRGGYCRGGGRREKRGNAPEKGKLANLEKGREMAAAKKTSQTQDKICSQGTGSIEEKGGRDGRVESHVYLGKQVMGGREGLQAR